jgi:capsular exopolysaccharide synthesis family protein
MLPAISSRRMPATLLINGAVPSHFAEACRAVRTNLLFSAPDSADQMRSIVISSAAPHEGKTVVATNLAVALAQAGQRVLLIDADMRRPRVHGLFDMEQAPGLSNVLIGEAALRDAVRATAVAGLTVLPAGQLPPNPAELLESRRFRELLSSFSNQFDWVILDSPPVLAVTDASVMGHLVSGVVFVVGSEMTSRQVAQAALEQFAAGRARVLGAVLNRIRLDRNAYYYSKYYKRVYGRYYSSPAQS